MDINSAGGRREGLTAEQIATITTGGFDGFEPKEQLLLKLADALAATPANVSQELFDALHAEFTEEQLIELAAACAQENFRARWNRLADVGSQGFYHVRPKAA